MSDFMNEELNKIKQVSVDYEINDGKSVLDETSSLEVALMDEATTNLASNDLDNKDYDDALKKLLSIPFGTVIFANRYENDEEKILFGERHRRGPYIVVGRNDKELICIRGTGTKPKNHIFLYDILFESNRDSSYRPLKDTYFSTSKLYFLDIDRNVSKLASLDFEDTSMLASRISIAKSRKCYDKYGPNIRLDIPEITLDTGYIIFKDYRLYFVFDITDTEIEAFRVFHGAVNENKILINKKFYSLDFDNKITFPSNDRAFCICDLVSKSQYYLILQKMKKYFTSKNMNNTSNDQNSSKPIMRRGSVIRCKENYYYVYGEEGNEFMAFKVISQHESNYRKIEVEKKTFYTVFNDEITIPKKETENYDIVLEASDIEMDEIKKIKKAYKKVQKEKSPLKRKVQNLPYIYPGVIAETDTLSKEHYLVLDRNKNLVTWILVDDIFSDSKNIEKVIIQHVKRVGVIPKRDLDKVISWVNGERENVGDNTKTKIKKI